MDRNLPVLFIALIVYITLKNIKMTLLIKICIRLVVKILLLSFTFYCAIKVEDKDYVPILISISILLLFWFVKSLLDLLILLTDNQTSREVTAEPGEKDFLNSD